ncbi:aspartate aminotransferase family protein [Oecophyllibacter saccharovorans]|uniref:aspartate aminotransferase family protein n=1 Tax=Oecophyllibacter saccharovorans TaxID=2558360 RepID=UPI001141AF4C|nr:aspartate aminotransferase family protein [Oecophyllibacter saccharovorans]QDH15270.1 aspartate aminotransferase family protein [Oecophyllibacter saccharovorans]
MSASLMPNYKRIDLAFEHGEGPWLVGTDGRRYLDFGAGIAVSSLGHAHPALTAAIAEQAGRVMHVSNLYRIPQAEALADRLVEASFADAVLFCNSGAEANEGLVKLIRRAQYMNGHPERTRVLCFQGAFHGRTLAMISATGNPAYLEGFGSPAEGFDHVPFNDLEAVRAAITPETAGILLEPIQGESGIQAADPAFLQGLREICDAHGLYLGIDEVQTGMGRTGTLFAFEQAGITPDVVSVAKGLGGGFPIGAVLARQALARHLTPGTHGTTFGGNPLACTAGLVVMDELLKPGALQRIARVGAAFGAMLQEVVAQAPEVFDEVRGTGLMRGLHCRLPLSEVLPAVMDQGLLAITAGNNVLRLVPPLIVTEEDCRLACARLLAAAKTLIPASSSPSPSHRDARIAQ